MPRIPSKFFELPFPPIHSICLILVLSTRVNSLQLPSSCFNHANCFSTKIAFKSRQLLSTPINYFQLPSITFKSHQLLSTPINYFSLLSITTTPINYFQLPLITFNSHQLFLIHINYFQLPSITFNSHQLLSTSHQLFLTPINYFQPPIHYF